MFGLNAEVDFRYETTVTSQVKGISAGGDSNEGDIGLEQTDGEPDIAL